MMEKESKSKRILSWIFEEPFASPIPSLHLLDRAISCISRIIYIVFRIFLGISLGQERRNRLKIFKTISTGVHVSFSFLLLIFVYKMIRALRMDNQCIFQINVPKYKYKVYCPLTVDDYISMTVRERQVLEHFNPKKGHTVIDVGSHLGRYTLISANKVGKEGKVIAIEADPSVFKKLNKNLELNGFTNVTSLNYAVSSTKGKINLFFPDEGLKNTLYNTIISTRSVNSQKYIEVDADTLDNLVYSTNINPATVNWIKIDVEGAELEVLKGAHNILTKSEDISLLIEIHNLSDGKSLYENIKILLKSYNFQIYYEKIEYSGEGHIIARKH